MEDVFIPSTAAKINVEEPKRNNILFRNLMISREIPEPALFQDDVISEPFALMIIPESKVTVPRVVKHFGVKTFDKRSGIYDETDLEKYSYGKRFPGSVLTWTLAPSKLNQKTIAMRSDQGKHFQPSSFVATMGKKSI